MVRWIFSVLTFAHFFSFSRIDFRNNLYILSMKTESWVIFHRIIKTRKKKIVDITSSEILDKAVFPRPTKNIEKIRNGLSVRKSKTKLTTNVDVAASKEKLSLLFNI